MTKYISDQIFKEARLSAQSTKTRDSKRKKLTKRTAISVFIRLFEMILIRMFELS